MTNSGRKLFGTDGIRGVAGEPPLDRKMVYAIGVAIARELQQVQGRAKVVIGMDTRESSPWIAQTLAAGVLSQRGEVLNGGVVTTPGVAYLARTEDFTAGVVISASHNPWRDNGIKLFGHDGYKFSDQVELEIEQKIFAALEEAISPADASFAEDAYLHRAYFDWLVEKFHRNGGHALKLVVDCGNGAASAFAPEVLEACGFAPRFINTAPDGRNINANCGALHPEVVARAVVESGADIGICFDGDADRCLLADTKGNVINGDAILLLGALDLKRQGKLANDTVVATTMSNMGLEVALAQHGIKLLRTGVGDKYVLEEMRKTGAVLGGEQSGHIIFGSEATTGDGLLTALHVLEILARSGKPLAELASEMKVFPQVIRNVHVREKKSFSEVPAIADAIQSAESELHGKGRVVVRYSGTEKLARVMIEAESEEQMNRHAAAIAGAIEQTLGK